MANRLGRAERTEAATLQALEDHAFGHTLQAASVEMQVQARLLADQFDGVHVGGGEHHGGTACHIDAAARCQGIAQRVIGRAAREEHVALHALDARDDGPGRVVMRRLGLARQAGGQVQRMAPAQFFGEPVHLGRVAGRHGEVRLREQFALQAQRLQLAGHGLQLFGRGAFGIGEQPLCAGDEARNGGRTAAGHVAAAEVDGEMGLCHGRAWEERSREDTKLGLSRPGANDALRIWI
jgi:hypothetical protein